MAVAALLGEFHFAGRVQAADQITGDDGRIAESSNRSRGRVAVKLVGWHWLGLLAEAILEHPQITLIAQNQCDLLLASLDSEEIAARHSLLTSISIQSEETNRITAGRHVGCWNYNRD